MTPKTKNRIEAIKVEVQEKRDEAIKKQIDNAPDRLEALRLYVDSASLGFKGDATYKGKDIPTSFDAAADEVFVIVASTKGYGRSGWSDEKRIPVNTALQSIWLVGWDKTESFSPYKRKKLDQWQAKRNTRPNHYILVEKLPDSEWIDPTRVENWSEVAAEKIVRQGTVGASGKIAGSYKDVYVDGTLKGEVPASEIDTSKPVYWRNNHTLYGETVSYLSKLHPDGYTLVTLAANRIKKFQRDFPASVEITGVWHRDVAQKWYSGLHKKAKTALVLKLNSQDWLRYLDATQINDPALVKLIDAASERKYDKNHDEWHTYYRNWLRTEELPKEYRDVLKSYPLLTAQRIYGRIDSTLEEHYYMYINAVHSAKEEVSN